MMMPYWRLFFRFVCVCVCLCFFLFLYGTECFTFKLYDPLCADIGGRMPTETLHLTLSQSKKQIPGKKSETKKTKNKNTKVTTGIQIIFIKRKKKLVG